MAQDIKIKYIRLKATKCDKERVASIEMSSFSSRCDAVMYLSARFPPKML